MSNVHTFDAHNQVQLLLPPSTAASANSSWVAPFADGGGADRAVFMLVLGATTQDVTFKVTQALDSSGTTPKDITGAAIVALTSATDEKVVTIEIGPGAMDDANAYKYVRGEVTIASAGTSPYTLLLIKHRLRNSTVGSQHASYSQQIRVY